MTKPDLTNIQSQGLLVITPDFSETFCDIVLLLKGRYYEVSLYLLSVVS